MSETNNKNHWPLPWHRNTSTGCFGSIEAANDEPVVLVQPLAPKFERDPQARNQFRNDMADYIVRCVNENAQGRKALALAREALESFAKHIDQPLPIKVWAAKATALAAINRALEEQP